MSTNGVPGCRCVRPLITIAGICTICQREKLHVLPKVPFSTAAVPQPDDGAERAA